MFGTYMLCGNLLIKINCYEATADETYKMLPTFQLLFTLIFSKIIENVVLLLTSVSYTIDSDINHVLTTPRK